MIKATLVVYDKTLLQNRIFDSKLDVEAHDGRLFKYIALKKEFSKQNIELCTQDIYPVGESKYNIYLDTILLPLNHANKLNTYLIILEPPSVLTTNFKKSCHSYFNKIFTWDDKLVDNKKYYKFNFSYDIKSRSNQEFKKDKFCVIICRKKFSNWIDELYSLRLELINWFEKNEPKKLDLYGYGWSRIVFKTYPLTFLNRFVFLTRLIYSLFKSKINIYHGEVESKADVLNRYKFSFCYENIQNIDGYITEKIFDCFFSGTIPIYLGAKNIEKFIPKECFIDARKFANIKDIYDYINSMENKEYIKYIKAIKNFLKSEKARYFDADYNAKLIVKTILNN